MTEGAAVVLFGTGHRPDKLGGYDEVTFTRLVSLARAHLEAVRPDRVVGGMALGWDQALTQAAIDLGIPFLAAIPFEGQEAKWPEASRIRYREQLARAERVEVVCEFYSTRALQIRNEWMVDNSTEGAALWDGSWGGTFNCLQYAKRKRRTVTNLWPRWAGDLTALLI